MEIENTRWSLPYRILVGKPVCHFLNPVGTEETYNALELSAVHADLQLRPVPGFDFQFGRPGTTTATFKGSRMYG